ncbi:hypothetical protein [Oerskovia enterophila]|uniref:hypothetical protein n=1 Tax=Oerskovia enterophila TaxID=43678 RepID=UPI00381BCD29
MSTDDLVRRAREWATGPIAARSSESTFTLVSELADEVDRLQAENDSLHSAALEGIKLIAGLRYQVESRTAERDEWAAQWRGANDMFGAMRDVRDELRAEVDRLTARTATLSETRPRLLAKYPHVGCEQVREEVEAERDAARAALERVRLITDRVAGVDSELAHRATVVHHLRVALEGEPS